MDVEAALALAGTAAGGAAGEAGRAAWQSLVTLARRALGRAAPDTTAAEPDPATAVLPAEPASTPRQPDAGALLAAISDRARTDPEFAAALCQWAETHRPALAPQQDTVTNTIADSATVHGHVIQARDVHGGINLGG